MKKFLIFMVAVIACITVTSCKDNLGVVWNIQAQATGEGRITITYPTGNPGLVVEGAASATATTTNDSTVNAVFNFTDGVFGAPNDFVSALDVLSCPNNYSKSEVKDAEFLMSEVPNKAVDFKAEGEWEASVTGYAKYGKMYFIIDEHFPPVDSVASNVPVDSPGE